ncbi:TlpA disulfide reductase family protein [Marinibaculum pumilum]|uniref:TlpA disulfide reductase family protein n=1 Tax=Marinibaculum pumilum TaxID=1766165 RepID=A0ABV7L9U0_9PROT
MSSPKEQCATLPETGVEPGVSQGRWRRLSQAAAATRLMLLALSLSLSLALAAGPATAGLDGLATGEVKDFSVALLPEPAPDVAFIAADGSEMRLADLQGKVVLLNFWATWCAPCVREMPSLDRLQAELGGEDFEVLAVSVDRGGLKTAGDFLRKHEIVNLQTASDPRMAMFRALGGKVMPTTLLIGADGKILGRLEGPAEWDSPEAKALVRAAVTGQ